MRLLYCYVAFTDRNGAEKPLRGMKELELNFSTTDVYHYDGVSNTLWRSSRETPLPDQFWANGTQTTNIYNINVVAGMNGSGKSTAIQYLMDLLSYIYHGFGQTLSDQERFVRHDPTDNRNLLLFETDDKAFILDLWHGQTSRQLHTECFAKLPLFLGKKKAQALLQGMKVINLTNTLTQRDYLLHIGNRNERLRNDFVYDCSIGATIGPDVGQFFPYEVYKQVKYLLDPKQMQERIKLEKTIPELRLPRELRVRLVVKPFENIVKSVSDTGFSKADMVSFSQVNLPTKLALLCAASFIENITALVGQKVFIYPQKLRLPLQEEHTAPLQDALARYIDQATEWIDDLSSTKIIIGYEHGILRVVDVNTMQCLQTIHSHTGHVTSVAALPDGCVISGSSDKTLRVWDTTTGQCLRTLRGHTERVNCLAILPDGRVVSGSSDKTLRVWDTTTGQCLQILMGHTESVTCVAVLPDGRVVSGAWEGTLRLWDASTGKSLQTFERHENNVLSVAILPNGRVISGGNDSALRVWDTETGQCLQVMGELSNSPITFMSVLPDGRVICGSLDDTLQVWDITKGQCVQSLQTHGSRILDGAVLSDGRVVLSIEGLAPEDNSLQIWDASTSKCLQTMKAYNELAQCLTVLHDRCNTIDSKVDLISDRAKNCKEYIQYVLDDPHDIISQFVQSKNDLDVYELPIPQDYIGERKTLEKGLSTFLSKYHSICTPYYTLDFDWGLSSGEENLLRLFSWLFHIFPRTGEHGEYRYIIRNNPENIYDGGDVCDSVMLIMDEADLTFHPEWQRRLIHILTAFLPTIYQPDRVKDLQLVLTTHSPLLLGDIPRENIHFLCRGKDGSLGQVKTESETFGQNIHTILKNSFFLEHGSVGQFAANKIDEMAKRLEALRQPELRSNVSAKEMEIIRRTIALVAPGVLRAKLEQMLREAEARWERPNVETLAQQTRLLSSEERQWLLRQLREDEK